MAAAHALGLRIPEDLSLVGYNDIPVVSRLPVPLSTVRVPFRQVAAGALELLLDDTDGKPPRTLIATPTLIPRRSTAAPHHAPLTSPAAGARDGAHRKLASRPPRTVSR